MGALSDVITALTGAAVTALPGVTVVDGPVVLATSKRQWMFVGANDTPGQPGATSGDGAGPWLPQFVVSRQLAIDCTIVCWSGVKDVAARRAEAEAIQDQVEQLLIPNPAGVVLGLPDIEWARIGGAEYTPRQDDTGATVHLVMSVEVQMRTETR